MGGTWFEERKEILIRELAAGFVEALRAFSDLYMQHRQEGRTDYAAWEAWIGSESQKGHLWRLKDLSHSIFRRPGSKPTMHETLLDWSLGTIFHECLRIREDAYQLAHPLKFDLAEDADFPEFRTAIEEWEHRIAEIRVSLRSGLEEVDRLFKRAWIGLKGTLTAHRQMGLLMRYLLENREQFVTFLGEDEWQEFMKGLHPLGEADACYLAGVSYSRSGWQEKAKAAFRRTLDLCPEYPLAEEIRRALEQDEPFYGNKAAPGHP